MTRRDNPHSDLRQGAGSFFGEGVWDLEYLDQEEEAFESLEPVLASDEEMTFERAAFVLRRRQRIVMAYLLHCLNPARFPERYAPAFLIDEAFEIPIEAVGGMAAWAAENGVTWERTRTAPIEEIALWDLRLDAYLAPSRAALVAKHVLAADLLHQEGDAESEELEPSSSERMASSELQSGTGPDWISTTETDTRLSAELLLRCVHDLGLSLPDRVHLVRISRSYFLADLLAFLASSRSRAMGGQLRDRVFAGLARLGLESNQVIAPHDQEEYLQLRAASGIDVALLGASGIRIQCCECGDWMRTPADSPEIVCVGCLGTLGHTASGSKSSPGHADREFHGDQFHAGEW